MILISNCGVKVDCQEQQLHHLLCQIPSIIFFWNFYLCIVSLPWLVFRQMLSVGTTNLTCTSKLFVQNSSHLSSLGIWVCTYRVGSVPFMRHLTRRARIDLISDVQWLVEGVKVLIRYTQPVFTTVYHGFFFLKVCCA